MSAFCENEILSTLTNCSVIGTQNEALNGQEGVATTFDTAKGRYHVQLPNKTIALKPVNLEAVSSADADAPHRNAPRASPFSGGFPNFSANSPQMAQAQAQMQAMLNQFAQVLPPGTDPQRALMAGGVYTLVMVYMLGLFQGLPVVSWTMYCFVYGFPAYRRGLGGINGVKAALQAIAARVGTDLGGMLGRPVSSQVAFGVTAGVSLLSCFFVASGLVALLGTPIKPPSAIPDNFPAPRQAKSGVSLADAYKKGYDAANNGEVYSNPYENERGFATAPDGGGMPSSAYSYGPGAGSSGIDIGKIVPLLVVGRMVYTMGKSTLRCNSIPLKAE